jgi:hypothetical protein
LFSRSTLSRSVNVGDGLFSCTTAVLSAMLKSVESVCRLSRICGCRVVFGVPGGLANEELAASGGIADGLHRDALMEGRAWERREHAWQGVADLPGGAKDWTLVRWDERQAHGICYDGDNGVGLLALLRGKLGRCRGGCGGDEKCEKDAGGQCRHSVGVFDSFSPASPLRLKIQVRDYSRTTSAIGMPWKECFRQARFGRASIRPSNEMPVSTWTAARPQFFWVRSRYITTCCNESNILDFGGSTAVFRFQLLPLANLRPDRFPDPVSSASSLTAQFAALVVGPPSSWNSLLAASNHLAFVRTLIQAMSLGASFWLPRDGLMWRTG